MDEFLIDTLQLKPWRTDRWSPKAKVEVAEYCVTWKSQSGSRVTLQENFFGLFIYARIVVQPDPEVDWPEMETHLNTLVPGDQLGRLNRNTGQMSICRFEEDGRPAAIALVAAPTGLQVAGWYEETDSVNVVRLVSDPLLWDQVEAVLPAGPSILLTEWAPLFGSYPEEA